MPPCIKAMIWCEGGGTGAGTGAAGTNSRRHEQRQGRDQSADTSFITSDHSGPESYLLCTAGERLAPPLPLPVPSIGLALIPNITTNSSLDSLQLPTLLLRVIALPLACRRSISPSLCHSTVPIASVLFISPTLLLFLFLLFFVPLHLRLPLLRSVYPTHHYAVTPTPHAIMSLTP